MLHRFQEGDDRTLFLYKIRRFLLGRIEYAPLLGRYSFSPSFAAAAAAVEVRFEWKGGGGD